MSEQAVIEQAPTVELTGEAVHGVGNDTMRSFTASLPVAVKLGRRKPKARPQALSFGAYYAEELMAVPPPGETNRYAKAADVVARMYMNNALGCCVVSSSGHMLGLWSANDSDSGGAVFCTDQEIKSQYVGVCGPGDQGCYITHVMDYMRDHGFVAGGKSYKIDGYVSVDWRNKLQSQVAVVLFGAINLGIDLPRDWTTKAIWDVTNSPSVGGHCVPVIDYNSTGPVVASWARRYQMTWAAYTSTRYVSEAYCVLAPLWYGADNLAPSGVDVAALKADLDKVGGGQIPPLPDPNQPPPAPPPANPIVLVVGLDKDNKEVARFRPAQG